MAVITGPRKDGRATWAAAAALLGSALSQRLVQTCRQTQLWSETCAWVLLLMLFLLLSMATASRLSLDWHDAVVLDKGSVRRLPRERIAVWMFVLGLVVVGIVPSQSSASAFLPTLVPLLVVFETRVRASPSAVSSSNNAGTASAWSSLLVNSFGGSAVVAAVAVGSLVDRNVRDEVFSLVPLAARLLVFSILTPHVDGLPGPSDPAGPATAPHPLRFFLLTSNNILVPVALRVALVMLVPLAAEMYAYGWPPCPASTILALAVAKAVTYFSLLQVTHSSWRIASAIETFGLISARDPFTLTSERQALLYVAGSLLAIVQVIQLLPRDARCRWVLWGFCLATVLPYLAYHADLRHAAAHAVRPERHPVEALMHQSRTRFAAMLQRQSQSVTAAVNEYRRRYGVPPPPGFEAWFAYAQAHDSLIIDEFDLIHKAVAPFWVLSGHDVQSLMRRVSTADNAELWLCTFATQKGQTTCTHPHRTFDRNIQTAFNMLLGSEPALRNVLPETVQFLVNHIDEPRVVIPSVQQPGEPSYTITTLSQQPVWEPVTHYCPARRKSNGGAAATDLVNTFGLPFVTDVQQTQDLCRHPAYRDMHGLLMCPTTFHFIEGRVPVLSPGALSTMGDILFPSAAYMEPGFRYDAAHDVPWEHKRNQLYWAGSTTGGQATDVGGNGHGHRWWQYQRHRFVALAQQLAPARVHQYLVESGPGPGVRGIVSRMRSRFLNGRLYDVAFTRVFQCTAMACRDEEAYFKTTAWAPADAAFESRLVFDLDGNGISGRFYRLLASQSAPLKQTLLREWHDERLQPWLHYFPVSQSLDELPELVAYLTSSPAGVNAARAVADQGRDWFQRAFRDVDMAIYMYRLLLELARLQDPERRAGEPAAEPAAEL